MRHPQQVPPPTEAQAVPRHHVKLIRRNGVAPFVLENLRKAIKTTLTVNNVSQARMVVVVTNNEHSQAVNRQFLQHDFPTDVISFPESAPSAGCLRGELLISAEVAAAKALEFGWQYEHELALYAVHGTLHLVGLNDQSPEQIAEMQAMECQVFRHLGWPLPPGRGS